MGWQTKREPKEGEEESLAEKRQVLMHREKLVEAINGAYGELAGERGAERALAGALRSLTRIADKAGSRPPSTPMISGIIKLTRIRSQPMALVLSGVITGALAGFTSLLGTLLFVASAVTVVLLELWGP